MDLDKLKRSAELARDSHSDMAYGQLSIEAFDARWRAFRQDCNPIAVLELIAEIKRLRATAASGAVPEWMPIETAPKKGRSLILLLTPSGWPQVAYSNTWWTSGFSVESKPTRWMPLPPASNADKPKDGFPPDWGE